MRKDGTAIKSMSPVSQEGTIPTSTCKSDLDEHQDQRAHLPKTTKFDPEMLKRLNERQFEDNQIEDSIDNDTIPPF